jgi:chitinase
MNNSNNTTRIFLGAALAAFVTIGCSGGGSGSNTATTAPAGATDTGTGTGGNGTPSTGGATQGPTDSGTAPAPAPAAHANHSRCGWIGADTFDAGKASFLANPDYYDAIHPKWAVANADGTARILTMADDAQIMATAKAHHIKVIPLIDVDDVSHLRSIISSPASIAAHAKVLTDMVVSHGYDGVELDYEHLWSAADRAPYTALIVAASASLHAQGKVLTLALPAMDADAKESAYDYVQLQSHVDTMHLMAYDFHYMGGDHLGPLAPKGWVQAVVTRVKSLGSPEKYVLGVANYGISSGWYTTAKDAATRCSGGVHSMSTDHMLTCPLSHAEAGLSPHCTTSNGEVYFEDVASLTEKVSMAKAAGLGGVGYWTMGDEMDGFYTAMKAQFPN